MGHFRLPARNGDENLHTAHHGKNEGGRAPDIEPLIDASVQWAVAAHVAQRRSLPSTVLDAGCDYGYALDQFALRGCQAYGVDLYHSAAHPRIARESLEDPLLREKLGWRGWPSQYDMVFLNHTLEHLYNPWAAMRTLCGMARSMFVAVPAASAPWSRWEGHYTIWTRDWLDHFMGVFGLPAQARKRVCFRDDCVELWGFYAP
jgi:2-polyprenyl-3-methyl-5-hydroxy-6-metoxy-1,4-benzoquinol methylase